MFIYIYIYIYIYVSVFYTSVAMKKPSGDSGAQWKTVT